MKMADPAEYIAAMSLQASSVSIITTMTEDERFGLTATAVTSVTAEPPRLLVCVNKSGITHQKIIEAGRFCVNIVSDEQDGIAKAFAGMGDTSIDRFNHGAWGVLKTGSPVLKEAVASFDCMLCDVSDQSTHSVLFGDVHAVSCHGRAEALLYGGRRFRQLRKIFLASGGGHDDYL